MDIIRFTREDIYKFLFVEYNASCVYGFNLCVKVEQTAVINIVKDMTDFTVEGWKIGKEIPTWVHGYDKWDYPVDGNKESMHDEETEVVNVYDPDDTDSVVVRSVCDNVDEAVDKDIEVQYLDGLKDNVTDDQDEKSTGVKKRIQMATQKGKVLRSRVKKSLGVMTRTLTLLLLHLLIPYMLGMVNGRMRLKDSQLIARLGLSVSTQNIFNMNIYLHPILTKQNSNK